MYVYDLFFSRSVRVETKGGFSRLVLIDPAAKKRGGVAQIFLPFGTSGGKHMLDPTQSIKPKDALIPYRIVLLEHDWLCKNKLLVSHICVLM